MKKNITKSPTIDSITLGSLNFPDTSSLDNALHTPFDIVFFYGDSNNDYLGDFRAKPENFIISETSFEKLKDLILSLENDVACHLFGNEGESVKIEGEKDVPADIKQVLEWEAPIDDTFTI